MVEMLGWSADAELEIAVANAERLFGGVKMQYLLTIWVFVVTTVLLAWIAWRSTTRYD